MSHTSPVPEGRQWSGGEIPLGAFHLQRLLGCGGMAEVWAAVHRPSGRRVAVKVMTGPMAKNPAFVAAFRREVQTVAALDHPNIAMVLDYGAIPAGAARLSKGYLSVDSPYLVMELAHGGDLVTRWEAHPFSWTEVRAVMLELLAALGHAHARGVIHRDIKGDNLLWFPHQHRWKLTDFGIAHALARAGDSRIVGTPQYMAPELFACAWRDFGPWTDLYSAGCLFYEMVAGRLPFKGDNAAQLGGQHLKHPVPRLQPRLPVPDGMEGWLGRLLAKHPFDRFQFAADAAEALLALGDPEGYEAPLGIERRVSHPADSMISITGDLEMRAEWTRASLEPPTADASAGPPVAPMNASWRTRPRGRPFVLRGAGLGLYGLRTVPIAGRVKERNDLWSALVQVADRSKASVVVLRGAAGTGKSRLARWLCEEAHETGAADTMTATFSEQPGPGNGLPAMVTRFLRCGGLGAEARANRTRVWFRRRGGEHAWEWETVAALMADDVQEGTEGPSEAQREPQIRRFGALASMLGLAASLRPIIVWLDDAQWAAEALEFVELVSKTQKARPMPVLFVLTVRDEALVHRPFEARKLEGLWNQGGREIQVEALRPAARRQLVGSLLGLQGDLARRVAEHTGGNPLFAVQMVGDWVRRGVLELGRNGFVLRDGEQISLPDSLRGLWGERLDEVLDGGSEDDRRAMEVAAALGNEMEALTWLGACAIAGVSPSHDLVDRLVDRRLAVWTEDGWRFVHSMLRASLERDAREAGRWAAHNDACARFLEQNIDKDTSPDRFDRLGRHLLEAEAFEGAAAALLRGSAERSYHAEYQTAETLLELREEALERLKLPREDSRWGHGWVARARLCCWQARNDEAAQWAERALDDARAFEWADVLPDATVEHARVLSAKGRLEEGNDEYSAAIRLFEADRNQLAAARTKLRLGFGLIEVGALEDAEELILEAKDVCDSEYDLDGIVIALVNLASVYVAQKKYDQARESYQRGLRHYEARSDRLGVLQCLNGLAEIDRAQGRYQQAATVYAQLIVEWDEMGSHWSNYGRVNLALCYLNERRFADAEVLLTEVTHDARRRAQFSLLGGVHAELMPCAAARGDWEAWDRHRDIAVRYLDMTQVADYDDAWPLQLAGTLAAEAGQVERAKQALRMAHGLWVRLNDTERLAEIDRAMTALG